LQDFWIFSREESLFFSRPFVFVILPTYLPYIRLLTHFSSFRIYNSTFEICLFPPLGFSSARGIFSPKLHGIALRTGGRRWLRCRWLSVALDRKRKGHSRDVWYVMVDICLSPSTAYIGKSWQFARSELFTRTIVFGKWC